MLKWVPASWLSRRARAIQSVSQSSQVQTIADDAKLSLSNDRPIMSGMNNFGTPSFFCVLWRTKGFIES
jgi:hypothetical protein